MLKSYKAALIATVSLILSSCFAAMAAGPQTAGQNAAKTAAARLSDVPVSSRAIKVWEVTQSSNWGKSKIKACSQGIRIEANQGSILVAKAPTWEVVVFRKGQKKASKNSYAKFITKYPTRSHAEKFRGVKRLIKIAGAPAMQYVMPLNRRLDAADGFGHTFQAKLETPYVSNMMMSIAADSIQLPPQAKEIWRTYFEFSFVEKVPLEYYMELGDGSKRYQFQTLSQRYVNVPASEFDHPNGLEYTGEFMQMIYGQKMEDVADLLMSP
ncbi:MAG: hypothetical protein K2Y39_07250 [Candidatus Obscuribacterales bacterium]|nr:hypothetical protein [Candidatus Obscuribacterales bacterium]